MRIVIVEDDEGIRTELKILLENNGYEVSCITVFSSAVKEILEVCPDLVLLDMNLPGTSGLLICDGIRASSQVPIIFVTSNQTSMDELNCILRGGDDYITKPYQVPILLARIGMVLKRVKQQVNQESTKQLEQRGVTLDLATARICYQDSEADLTKNELKILACLFQNKNQIVQRTQLIDYLWDNEIFIDDNTLSVNITRIRSKLESIGVEQFIETKRGLGYKI